MEEYARYFEFLRYSLGEEQTPPPSYKEIDWEKLYVFARHQTVEATFWRGIQRLDQQGLVKLSEEAVLTWMARCKKIERRNNMVYEKAAWVWKNFKKEGFRSCVLKGQGNALLYPTPLMRTPGDIDIWVEGSDKDIIAYVDSVCPGFKRSYHHIDFINAGKVPVEVHYRPSWMSNPLHNKRLQEWFKSHAEECFSNEQKEWGFCVPTYEFNCIFLLSHLCAVPDKWYAVPIIAIIKCPLQFPEGNEIVTVTEIRSVSMWHLFLKFLPWYVFSRCPSPCSAFLCDDPFNVQKIYCVTFHQLFAIDAVIILWFAP